MATDLDVKIELVDGSTTSPAVVEVWNQSHVPAEYLSLSSIQRLDESVLTDVYAVNNALLGLGELPASQRLGSAIESAVDDRIGHQVARAESFRRQLKALERAKPDICESFYSLLSAAAETTYSDIGYRFRGSHLGWGDLQASVHLFYAQARAQHMKVAESAQGYMLTGRRHRANMITSLVLSAQAQSDEWAYTFDCVTSERDRIELQLLENVG
jgi:hypothetical protein